jgi:alpha-mannosidase
VKTSPRSEPWRAAVDAGELKFNFLLASGDDPRLPQLARELEQPPVTLTVPPHDGKLGRSGSLGALEPDTLHLLALKPAADGKGLILRVQETSGQATQPKFTLKGKTIRLPKVPANRIATFRLTKAKTGWKVRATSITEL